MRNYVVLIVIIILVLMACNDQRSDLLINQGVIKRDIPLYKNGKEVYAYTSISKAASKLNLDSLELGFDSIQIRIWFGFAKSDSSQIFIIKNQNNKWSAESILLKYLWNDTSYETTLSDTIVKVNYNQTINWTKVMKDLSELQITTLPDMDKIEGYKNIDGIDGNGCTVEISTKDYYRFYGYWNPASFQEQYWQAKNMIGIVGVIKKEFSFKLLGTL